VYNGRETTPKESRARAREQYEGDVDRLIDGFGRQAQLVQQLEGSSGAYLLVDVTDVPSCYR
jgi:hypothetical protein